MASLAPLVLATSPAASSSASQAAFCDASPQRAPSLLDRTQQWASASTSSDSLAVRPPTPNGLTPYEWAEALRRDAAMVTHRNEKRARYESHLSRRGTGETRQSFNAYKRAAAHANYTLAKMDERDRVTRCRVARNVERAAEQAQQSALLPKLVSVRRTCEDGEVVPLPEHQAVFVTPEGLVGKVVELFAQRCKRLSWREVQSALQPTLGLVPEGAARRAVTAARKQQRTS